MALNGPGRNGRKPAPYVHQSWPGWYYGPDGQSAIFNGPLEVPDGWHDSPKKFGPDGKALKGAVTEIPGYDEAVAGAEIGAQLAEEGGDTENTLVLPAYEDITARQIKERLDKLGVGYDDQRDDKPTLYKALSAAIEAAQEELEEGGEADSGEADSGEAAE